MFNMMKADFYKLWKSKILLWITLGLLGIILLGNMLAQSGDGVMVLMSDTMNYNTVHFTKKGTGIMLELLKGSNIIIFFLIPVVINVFISDFKYMTIKNTVSYKYTRTKVYLSKLILCSLFAVVLPILYVSLGFIVSVLFNGIVEIKSIDFLTVLKIILLQLPIYIGFIGLMIFVGVLFRSNLATTLFTVLYQLAMVFVSSITTFQISNIEPITCLDRLAYLNILNRSSIYRIEFIGFILILSSIILGIYLFNYRDIA